MRGEECFLAHNYLYHSNFHLFHDDHDDDYLVFLSDLFHTLFASQA
nr:MAG TPA: hypothetical protein [Caudoviricetes sp.]